MLRPFDDSPSFRAGLRSPSVISLAIAQRVSAARLGPVGSSNAASSVVCSMDVRSTVCVTTTVDTEYQPWLNATMLKQKAIELLGGTVSAAAEAIGISYQAVDKWPDELPPRIADRVQAAMWRMSKTSAATAEQQAQDGAVQEVTR